MTRHPHFASTKPIPPGTAGDDPLTKNPEKALKELDRPYSVAAITGMFALAASVATLVSGYMTKDAPSTQPVSNCAEQQQQVLRDVRENSEYSFTFSGPSDEQCHLNELLRQIKHSR